MNKFITNPLIGIKKQQGIRTRKSSRVHGPYAHIDWSKASALFQKPLTSTKKPSRIPNIGTLLHFLGAAGAAGITFIFEAGNMSTIEALDGEFSYRAWSARQQLNRLKNQKDVTVTENSNHSLTVRITKSGLVKALTYELDTMKLTVPKKWDAKWRVVIYDIAEKHSRLRTLFRTRLKQLGLYQLQESVYISPYSCFPEVEFLRELYGVSFTVRYLLVDNIEDDTALKTHFRLS